MTMEEELAYVREVLEAQGSDISHLNKEIYKKASLADVVCLFFCILPVVFVDAVWGGILIQSNYICHHSQ